MRHTVRIKTNQNTGSKSRIYDNRYEITKEGEEYLHKIESTNMTSLRSWIAIVISAIALVASFF